MKTVKVTPDNIISIINVDFDDFRDLQKAVGGHFETVSTKTLYELQRPGRNHAGREYAAHRPDTIGTGRRIPDDA